VSPATTLYSVVRAAPATAGWGEFQEEHRLMILAAVYAGERIRGTCRR
jgi:hypothetical protein